jgi:hypothetical protein
LNISHQNVYISHIILPGIINQLGPDNLDNLKKIAEQYSASGKAEGAAGGDDDGVPELVDDFEQVRILLTVSLASCLSDRLDGTGVQAGLRKDMAALTIWDIRLLSASCASAEGGAQCVDAVVDDRFGYWTGGPRPFPSVREAG